MITYSQPPQTPIALAGTTETEISYSLAQTDKSVALSCSFPSNINAKILEIVREHFPEIETSEKGIKKVTSNYEYKIILKPTEFRLEFKSQGCDEPKEYKVMIDICNQILSI